jgi:hypothetical protein
VGWLDYKELGKEVLAILQAWKPTNLLFYFPVNIH